VHYIDSVNFENNPNLENLLSQQPQGSNPLRICAQLMLLDTNVHLVQLLDDTVAHHPEIKVIDIGIKYDNSTNANNLNSDNYTFIKILYWNNKFLSFSCTADESYLDNLITVKNQFFNSISIN
jgi:hypothetical protein